MTAASASNTDTMIEVYDTDGVTLLENDDNDGSYGGTSSSIAGLTLPATGTYYVRVRNAAGNQIRPYHLHYRLRSGSPAAESEPNDAPPQALPAGGWVNGSLSSSSDVDQYSFTLNAGDSVFLSVDADPERDGIDSSPSLGVGLFGDASDSFILATDPGGPGPDSEALFMTVKNAGTYYARVFVTGGGSPGTYHLSVSFHLATSQGVNCTTYTAAGLPVAIADLGLTSSTIAVPGHPRVQDVDVSIQLSHANMPDLDAHLRSPEGNDNGLFTDVGNPGQTMMDLTIDDEAAFPIGQVAAVKGTVNQPESSYRLSWFDGEDAGGTWMLDLRDDTTANSGTLTGWSLTICEAPIACAGSPVTIYESDFESGDGGFVHSGTADEWERGLPAFAPITTCHSGTSCWKTDLDDTYDPSSSQDLLSPSIGLAGVPGAVTVSWAQRYQMESALQDHISVDVRQAGGANPKRLFEWLDATMTDAVGSPPATIQESSGWSVMTADITSYAGQNIELLFHLDSSISGEFAGLAIDDVKVSWCCTAAAWNDNDACTTDSCGASGCVHTSVALVDVVDVMFAADKQTLSWSAAPAFGRYDVARGSLSALPVGPGAGDEICFNNVGTSTMDSDLPASASGFWYVVRGEGGCGVGPYGTTSAGSPRVTTTCP